GFICLNSAAPAPAPAKAVPALPPVAAPREANAQPAKPGVPEELPLRTYINNHQHFSFVLPASWIEMPDKELQQAYAFLREHLGGQKIVYDTGLRLRGNRAWSYPYVLIQITPLPQEEMSYEDLEEHLRDDLPGALREAKGALGDMAHDLALNSAVLD